MIAEGTPPARFAREHAHYRRDLPFWRALAAESASPVLDLGAASGRVAIPLARDGHEVWALDASEGMLAALRGALAAEPADVAARVHPVRADLRDFALGRSFPLAVMPMNTLQTFLSRDEQLACLGTVRGHLDPLGELVLDLVVADLEAVARAVGVEQPAERWVDPADGATLERTAWYEAVDAASGTVRFTACIVERWPDGRSETHLRPQTVHVFAPTEMWELAVEAGYEVRAVYGDFDGGPLDTGSELQVYRLGVAR